jgi:soluble lytic murein transglycosylase-like protein
MLVAPAPLLGATASEVQLQDQPIFVLLEHHTTALVALQNLKPDVLADHAPSPSRGLPRIGSATRARVLAAVRAAELRYGLPTGLLDALIATESAYLPWAMSRAGAGGLAQLMPATAAELGVDNRFDPLQSIDGGARYLRRMLDRFGSVSLALAAYNAGPGSVLRARGIPFNGETPDYVRQVLRRWASLPAVTGYMRRPTTVDVAM